ncbi:unnamed protein product [Cylindrotheca closterium]|uniref:Uncharacterized protein n=1 Tax=Cylindrotheca closterium TaxID=2856 RepID=A0AAD2FLM2_9STRA|nr:unnamed protein product [Cylindrotheca closterium]
MYGKIGHIMVNCWQDEGNATQRQNGSRRRSKMRRKMGAIAKIPVTQTDKLIKGEPQGMLNCHEVFELLNDPNIWIADTGALVDTIPYLDKLENVEKLEDGKGNETLMEGLQA